MLFILNIIKNNHAQGENTKESIFAVLFTVIYFESNARKASHAILSEHLY